jgi:1,5-anhydro-D-fructose reductase (1,5-anhydro-D-mannitol-forming)
VTGAALRLAIVGVGWAGTRQTESVGELGDGTLQVVCLVDPDVDHLTDRSKVLGVERICSDLPEILADPDIDAVSICSPHRFHCEQAVAAAEAGKHILVEKPMAMDVDEATRMIDAASKAHVCLYVAESATYQPVASFLRDVVRQGRWIGELTAASVSAGFRAPAYGYPDRRAWLAQPEHGGTGTWALHGIHTIAQMRYVLGEVAVVYAHQHRAASFERDDVEATVSATLTLDSGLMVQLLQTAETKIPPMLAGYVLHGDRGSLHAGPAGCRIFTDEDHGTLVDIPAARHSEHALELEAFAATVAGVEGPTTGLSERRSLAVVEAGYESMRTGLPVDLEQRFGVL